MLSSALLYPPTQIPSYIHSSNILLSKDQATVVEYKSGKNPYGIDKNDPKKGTKKDYTFLKCISNCKSDCELPGEGKATDRSVACE
jgi:hypothetical protein